MTPETAAGRPGRWWPAPAKLNLFLHVTGRRADGYHLLQTLFQLLDWGDEVFIEPTADGRIERRGGDYAVPAEDDLAIRAALALRNASGASEGAIVEVRKEVPIGAGLGGGSSDAATVLVALNHLWDCGLSIGALAELGLALGADVPVFVHGHSAIATGVGEILEPVSTGARHYLLVMPELHVSTAEVFGDPRLSRDSAPISAAEAVGGGGRNDCEPVACARHPELAALIADLRRYGEPRMSGTGSAVFVPMASRTAAEAAAMDAERIAKGGSASDLKCRYNVRAVGGLDQSPLHRLLGYPPARAIEH